MAKDVFVLLCAGLCLQFAFGQFGFFPQRENRRFNSFGAVQNFFENPRKTLQTILHFGPDRENQNRPGIINGLNYDQYGRPNYPNNLNPNQYYYDSFNYPDRDHNNGNNVIFEPRVTDIPFEGSVSPNKDTNNYPIQYPGISNEEYNIDIVENSDNKPGIGVNFEENSEGTPDTTPTDFNNGNNDSASNNEFGNGNIFNVPPSEFEDRNNGIPNVPPPGFEDRNNGIPNVPSPGFEDTNNGIPNVPPPGFEDRNNGIPNTPPVTDTPLTTLAPLTPVPDSDTRNNFNFGSQGIFMQTCETLDGGIGSCINVFQCEPYFKLLKQSKSNPAAVQVLRKAHCGFDGNNPKVCCPSHSIPTDPPKVVTPTEAPVTPATEAPLPSGKKVDGDYVSALPEPPVCGVSNASFTRVVGGVNAKLGDFPWMALLGYKGRGGQGTRWLCGGSLISSRHVLTAAHCIHGHEDDLYLVRLGELDLAKDDEGATPVDVLIKNKIKHEEYSPKAFTNDIGILVLDRKVKFTNFIRPICIPKDRELRARSFVNYNPIIAGWGDTEFRGPTATLLQALQLPVVTNEFCAQAYSQYKAQKIDERVLCAGYKNGGKDACQGDSGGPLMQPIWNSKKFVTHFYQIGVVSYGKRCAEAGFPGVYTRVTHFVPWLEEKVVGTV
ncbi:unnamed protein product [Parnassius apollo]|uniref:(apollo) hypothetical protein n=1 Tax=Parnassius apollo TaxID=110799 RepID=A0A8S3Y7F8_PARAO|nr:unnamed protein product [Parnassius apollo]